MGKRSSGSTRQCVLLALFVTLSSSSPAKRGCTSGKEEHDGQRSSGVCFGTFCSRRLYVSLLRLPQRIFRPARLTDDLLLARTSMATMVQVSLTRTIPPPSYKTPILSPRPIRHISLPPAKPLDNPLSIFFPSIRLGSRSASPEYRPDAAPTPLKPVTKRHRSSNSLDVSPTGKKRILLERLMHRRPRPRSNGIWRRTDDSPVTGVMPIARRRDPSPLSLDSILNDNNVAPVDSAAVKDKSDHPRKKRKTSDGDGSARRSSIAKTPKGTRPPPLNVLDKKEPIGPRPDRGLISPVVTGFPIHTADGDTLDSVSRAGSAQYLGPDAPELGPSATHCLED